jgi:hypothetical protein
VPPPGRIVQGKILLRSGNHNGDPTQLDLVTLDPHSREARRIRAVMSL